MKEMKRAKENENTEIEKDTKVILSIKKIEKWFKTKNSIKSALNIDFLEINRGDRILLIGSNGSGKSTLIKIICSFITPSNKDYSISFEGKTNSRYKHEFNYIDKIAVVPSSKFFPTQRTVSDFLNFCDDISGFTTKERGDLIKEHGNTKCDDLSTGWKNLLMLFLLKKKKEKSLIILDEPYNGLDPSSTFLLKKQIESFFDQKMTSIVITHRIDKESLPISKFNRIIIMKKGMIACDRLIKKEEGEDEDEFVEKIIKISLEFSDQKSEIFSF